MSQILNKLLESRGLKTKAQKESFLHPDYEKLANPMLLPDMDLAVKRMVIAHKNKEKIVIYGDYDIDGLSATALLHDAFTQFGLNVSTFIPSRFDDGYGLSEGAIEKLAKKGAKLIVTVDCGSLSFKEIDLAKKLGIDVIVTDHHNLGDKLPAALAVINPKRKDHEYPFRDFSGVGVAFSLVRAMQTKLKGLEPGHEKWLLDLVALGTICDIVPLLGENRILAYWGLKVLAQTRRPGLKALMAVARIEPSKLSSLSLGFGLGPRLNASGRLENARLSLDVLLAKENGEAFTLAQELDAMNTQRRKDQRNILEGALLQAEQFEQDEVLVLSHQDWNHGIVGIAAAKIVEIHAKPTFVLQEIGDEAKGSARSFGDFSVGEAIAYSEKHIITGGGHTLAAGVTMKTQKVDDFRKSVNDYYKSLSLKNQKAHLLPKAEVILDNLSQIDEKLVQDISLLEPFGDNNEQPIFLVKGLVVKNIRKMGDARQHVKLGLQDGLGNKMEFVAFNAPEHFLVENNQEVDVWCTFDINEWQGAKSVEGRLLELNIV